MDTPAEVDAGTLGIPDLLPVLRAVAEACGQREADLVEADLVEADSFLIGPLPATFSSSTSTEPRFLSRPVT